MSYSLFVQPSAQNALAKLERDIRYRIGSRIDALARDPRPPGTEKLSGTQDLYRIRIGEYRVIHPIRDKELRVLVVRVGHRKDVYR